MFWYSEEVVKTEEDRAVIEEEDAGAHRARSGGKGKEDDDRFIVTKDCRSCTNWNSRS